MSENKVSYYADVVLGVSLIIFVACFAFGRSFREISSFIMLCAILVKKGTGQKILPSDRLNRPLFVFIFSLIISFIFSVSPARSAEVLLDVAKASIVFFAVACYVKGEREVMRLLLALFFLAVIQGFDGIYQYLTGIDFIRGDMLPSNKRVTGSFGYWSVGNLMAFVLPMSFVLMEVTKRLWAKAALSFAIFLPITTLILTKTRSAWMSFIFAILLMVLLSKRKVLYFPVLIMPLLFALLAPSHLIDRFNSIGRLDDSGRLEIWATGVNMFKGSPIVGHGEGSFKTLYAEYKVDLPEHKSPDRTPHAHNIYIHALAETGLIGLFAFLYLLFSITVTAASSVAKSRNTHFLNAVSVGLLASIVVYLIEGMMTHGIFRMWQMQIMALFIGMILAVYALTNKKSYSGEILA